MIMQANVGRGRRVATGLDFAAPGFDRTLFRVRARQH